MTPLGFSLQLWDECGVGPLVEWLYLSGEGRFIKLHCDVPPKIGETMTYLGRTWQVERYAETAGVWRMTAVQQ